MVDIKYRNISWEEVDDMVADLAIQIAESGNIPNYLMGIPRGGLIPATMLSHKLGIGYSNKKPLVSLIVDEICDSGKTLEKYNSKYKKYTTAVLVYKPHTSIFVPDFYSLKYEGDDWLRFPWEV